MTIRQFTDDYVEAKGVRIISLARVMDDNAALLSLHFTQGNTLGFLYECARTPCILIKHKALMRQFFGKVQDLEDDMLLSAWDDASDWNNFPISEMITDRLITHLEGLYGKRG